MNAEKIKRLRDLVSVCNEVGDDTAELFQYLADLLEAQDKAEPVATIIESDEDEQIDGGTISIEQYLKLCELPIDERAEFEKWANKHKGGDPLKANENGRYPNPFANAAFEAWQAARKLSAPQVSQQPAQHLDNLAVDRFAAAMKAKMAKQRAKGYAGWDDPEQCPIERLQTMLNEHLVKGDPVDIGNFAMMLFNRETPTVAPVVPDAKDEIDHDGIWTNSDVAEQRYIQGWNDCRAAMLKGEK